MIDDTSYQIGFIVGAITVLFLDCLNYYCRRKTREVNELKTPE